MPPTSASKHYRRILRLQAVTVASIRRAWRGGMASTGSWETQYRDNVGPKVAAVVTAAQIAATRESDAYVAEVLNELAFGPQTRPGVVLPRSLAGVTGDGRPTETLLASSVGRARALSQTTTPEEALEDAEAFMERVAQAIIEDTVRAAEEVAMAQRPWVAGYIRVAEPDACSRCIVLAGKFYLFNAGFLRHPLCRCNHLPAPDDPAKVRNLIGANSPERYFDSLSAAEQDRIFTKAGADAIREGADIGRVVNARRGMSKAQDTGRLQRVRVNGRDVYVTTEATTRRGRARGQTRGVRLMPESIFEIAGDDRDEALRLLRVHGYTT